ncbi:hypothetical protein COU17_01610 [Candidatus Kaiserbacteria bacterium CG10_big_fil_rev_8_21_14_0_10_49_17]|uniref:VanZ-like domain-containing protein n=1 Tax=Candidatus Kaiserbacteria bacterium CG10_big_fil_rev_8_21_14_0_10_49_17 TaxID=1974609 RepID=A0A2M6WEI0_9BACT|nr:MAG: hypothetical protein COU17_01610 [Candidatus Kaiserbacteria bacterium CG10_big_fil_rev_8_21_14_0_10_49_17]
MHHPLKHPLFKLQFFLLALLAAVHFYALKYFLYWSYLWLDMFMHYLGGLWLGVIALWFFYFYTGAPRNTTHALFIALGMGLGIGGAWEVFEVFAGLPVESNYVLDTAIDMLMDTLGVITAWFCITVVFFKHGQ